MELRNNWKEITHIAVMGLAALLSWLGLWRSYLPLDFIGLFSAVVGGYPIYKETFQALSHKHVNMEVSMTLAITASLLIGQFTAAAVVAFFVILAEFLEDLAMDQGKATLLKLEETSPKKALVRRNGVESEVDVHSVAPNDIVLVRDGERIPVDGAVVKGSALVNQSTITGETISAEKTAGNKVYAGTINESGLLEVRTERIGTNTIFGKIIELMKEAENRKAPIEKIADKLATKLVLFAIVFSVVTFIVTRNLISTISVIVVAGACGVAAGTPLAMIATIGNASKRGVIVKGGTYIEELSRVDTVVIDKTGTLTFGVPVVTDVTAVNGSSQEQVLRFAATAEKYSKHPIATAIIEKADELGIRTEQHSKLNYVPGKGVSAEGNGHRILVGNNILLSEEGVQIPTEATHAAAQRASEGKTVVYVAQDKKTYGLIAVSDRLRDESKTAITDLRIMGIKTIMLTGDNKVAAEIVAKEVGIEEVSAELLPQDKVEIIKRLVAEGHRVAMVGDGINDAPALAYAQVGIGMGTGTDVTIEEADIVLMTNDLQRIAYIVRASKKAYRTIMQNFYGTVTVDGVGVALAFLGFLNPLLAAGIHVASEFAFISNSARLIK